MMAADLMSHPAVTVGEHDSICEAAAVLMRWQIFAAPVIDRHGNLVGMVSTTDLVRGKFAGIGGIGRCLGQGSSGYLMTPVGDVMATNAGSLSTATPARFAVRLLADERIRCLPVLEGKTVVGIISRRDLAPRGEIAAGV